jgi:putative phosphonate metabolism protein
MSERYAIYFTLAQNDALYQLAAQWLGYDFYQGNKPAIQMDHHAILKPLFPYTDYTAKASLYGFHATLKAPFRLKPRISHKQLVKMLKHFSRLYQPFSCSALKLKQIGNFLALVPENECKSLNRLARDCVQTFDVFRDKLDADEIARRNPASLTDNQRLMLENWGYPYVLDEFRFHMTMTDALSAQQIERCQPLLESYFHPYTSRALVIDQLCLCYQATERSPFVVLESYPLKDKK